MKTARTPRAAMRPTILASMLPLAALALSAAPAHAASGGSAMLAMALTPASAMLKDFALPQPATALVAASPIASCALADVRALPSKSAIILKGAPSKLEQMRLAQAGLAPVETPRVPAVSLGALTPGPAYPASTTPTGALAAMPATDACLTTRMGLSADSTIVAEDPAAPTIRSDAEFGSRAMRVNRTRFDADWARVTRNPSQALLAGKLRAAGISAAAGEAELFKQVNNWVNHQIGYANDDITYARADYWATPAETIARGRGDCEDFAILKMQMLRAAGFDADRMKLVLLRDLAGGGDHAVLLVVDNSGQRLVLDNTTDRIYDGSRGDYFRPIFSYSSAGRFIHGIDTRPVLAAAAPVQVAMRD